MGEPAELTYKERTAVHVYAAAVIEAVRADGPSPNLVIDGDVVSDEMTILMMAQELVNIASGR